MRTHNGDLVPAGVADDVALGTLEDGRTRHLEANWTF